MVEIRHKDTGEVLQRVPRETLRGVDLAGVALYSANLERADLREANLQGASLLGAVLRRARLQQANLRNATLYSADLWGASLREADLRGTDLRGAVLQQANLSGALLAGARHDGNTRWPDGFDPAAHGALAPGGSPARAGDRKRKPREGEVLVVEDDSGIRMTVMRQLQVTGYGVATASNGREALAHLANGPLPALILLDLSMPEMDGWAFRIEQQKDPRLAAVPVVVCSAIYDPAPAAAMVRADAFLTKPYDLGMLLATVRRYCG
jgi:CheY-like chemotaxis protein